MLFEYGFVIKYSKLDYRKLIKTIINFYAQCYIADNRQFGIRNLLKSSLEGLHFITSIQTINTEHFPIHINKEVAENLLKQLTLYKNDKRIIVTFLGFKNKEGKVIPVYIIPGRLNSQVDEYNLEIDLDKKYVNPEFKQFIKKEISESEFDNLIKVLNKVNRFNDEDYIKLNLCLEKYSIFNINKFENFNFLLERKEIKKLESNSFFSQLTIGLIRRSIKIRSVLNELEELQKTIKFSKPLTFLFENNKTAKGSILNLFSPFTLNATQESIAKNCLLNPISLVTGPPGTGKSFTIAAIALNAAMQGKSVLISSKTDQSVDVIADKLRNEFEAEDLFMRGGSGSYKKDLKHKLKQIVSYKNNSKKNNIKTFLKSEEKLKSIKKTLKKLKSSINKRLEDEYNLSEYLIKGSNNFISQFFKERKIKKILKKSTLVNLIHDYQTALKNQRIYQKQYIKQFYLYNLQKSVKFNRDKINSFNASLGAQTTERKNSYFSKANINSILKYFPIWLINLQDIGNVFPFEKDLFDLVIIDEASQVDMASSIPLLQRGKSAIVVGDPLQLRHISFLSKEKEEAIKESNNLNKNTEILSFRDSSLYDICDESISEPNQIYSLHEHYRSKPSIINFSNKFYYGNQLVNLKKRDEHDLDLGLKFINIEGKRDKHGINQAEIDHIFKILKTTLKHKRNIKSVGIISPFRDQVDAIRKQVDEKQSFTNIKKLDLRIDTPYGFQGDERDIIIISLVINNNSSSLVHQYLNKPGVFNVSVTRARESQIILYSFKPTLLPKSSILRKYFEFDHKLNQNQSTYSDEFLNSVLSYLKSIGVKNIIINKEVGSLLIDITFYHKDQLFAIDLVGYPGQQEEYLEIDEHQMLERMSKKLIVISYFAWQLDKQKIESDIYKILTN